MESMRGGLVNWGRCTARPRPTRDRTTNPTAKRSTSAMTLRRLAAPAAVILSPTSGRNSYAGTER
jgi:hypothetical protein